MNLAPEAIDTAAYQNRCYPRLSDYRRVPRLPTVYNRVTTFRSPWNRELENRLNELSQLEPDWDGYRARPVLFSVMNFTAMIMEHLFVDGLIPPSLVPRSDGRVQIEWHKNRFDIELVVAGIHDVMAYRHDQLTGEENELALENDFTEVATWLDQLLMPREEEATVGA